MVFCTVSCNGDVPPAFSGLLNGLYRTLDWQKRNRPVDCSGGQLQSRQPSCHYCSGKVTLNKIAVSTTDDKELGIWLESWPTRPLSENRPEDCIQCQHQSQRLYFLSLLSVNFFQVTSLSRPLGRRIFCLCIPLQQYEPHGRMRNLRLFA